MLSRHIKRAGNGYDLMSNEELVLAISKLLDEKLDEKLSPIGQNLNQIDEQIKDIALLLENIVKSI